MQGNIYQLKELQPCIDLINKINNAILDINEKLKKKYENPYEPILVESSIGALALQLKTALGNLEKARVKHNEEAKQTDDIETELKHINDEIANYDIIKDAESLKKQKIKKVEAEKCYKESLDLLREKESVLNELNAKRHNIDLAVDNMNSCMNYIFFANGRLSIECSGDVYVLKSNGHSVKPHEISVGERNILGLSYFFTGILQGKDEKDAYGEEYLLIIDDPVSSFDSENRIGILSFLKYKLGVFLEGNRDTKALVMTHDIMTFLDTEKIFGEIIVSCNGQTKIVNGQELKVYDPFSKYDRLELTDKKIKQFNKNRQEYTELLSSVYKYALGQDIDEQDDLTIGNMMRQVLEAYSSFVYKKGIVEITSDRQILDQLPVEYRPYFNNLMCRLVLHGGSHREEQVKALRIPFLALNSRDDKIRTVQEILCFLYLLNPVHILMHLKDYPGDVESQLNDWCSIIRGNAVKMIPL